jgi:multicomponent Na+:H+ antiporter subunit G
VSEVLDVFAWIMVVVGCAFVFLAGLGIYKLPDTLTRMAAGSKASTLGLLLAVMGTIMHSSSADSRGLLFLGLIMVFVTSPLSAHLLGRAALKAGLRVFPKTQNTDLALRMRQQIQSKDDY